MAIKIVRLPELGEGVLEGEILKIKVSEGETVRMDQPLLEVMTDKASMEIPSSIEGKIQKIKAVEGEMVPVGAELFIVESQGDKQGDKQGEKKGETAGETGVEIKGETVGGTEEETGGEESSKQGGGGVPPSSTPAKSPLFDESSISSSSLSTAKVHRLTSSKKKPLAGPPTRKLALELGLSLEAVQGSGPNGEIKREDLLSHIRHQMGQAASVRGGRPLTPQLKTSSPLESGVEELKREPLRGLKRLMFESMTLSKAQIPHFTIGGQARMDRLMKVRGEIKARLLKQGIKTGLLPFFIKALLPVLREFPTFNSFYSAETREIVFRKGLDIGFAVDSPQGLLVPVLKSAQDKSLLEIIKEIATLAEEARQGQIKREDLKGAGITVSNLGSIGGLYGTPIINPPETAIIGLYSVFNQVLKDGGGGWQETPFINMSLTCDHRFIDGAQAARFLKSFTEKIEDPGLILLE